jgi:hypothetical protein
VFSTKLSQAPADEVRATSTLLAAGYYACGTRHHSMCSYGTQPRSSLGRTDTKESECLYDVSSTEAEFFGNVRAKRAGNRSARCSFGAHANLIAKPLLVRRGKNAEYLNFRNRK